MKHLPRPRKTASLSDAVQQRLRMYSIAASTAGVSMLALAQPTAARIVYTPADVTIKSRYILDLNHDGVAAFTLVNSAVNTTSGGFNYFFVKPAIGNAVEGQTGKHRHPWALALKGGARVGYKQHFAQGRATMATSYGFWDGSGRGGYWLNVANRYLGLKFEIDGRTHYGWARLSVQASGTSITSTLTGYAYETIPNEPIIAGKTKGPDVITAQPASLGHLAAGASAIPAWRSGK
jgi:hypothetical protein